MHIIITLAGHSRRFHEAGHTLPKFLLPVDGAPMVSHVVGMFDSADHYHFVINSTQARDYPTLPDQLKSLAKRTSVTVIEPHEQGPVFTALQVKDIPEDAPLIVTYCDFAVRWNYTKFLREVQGYDGAIPAFRGFHPASFGHTYYAYMRENEKGEMLELREKNSFTSERHKEPASAGIYYFRNHGLFKHYGEKLMQEGYDGLKEGYVSLLANPMVRDGLKVRITDVEKFLCWGTPEDYDQYTYWSRYFSTAAPRLPTAHPRQVNLMPMAGKGSRFREAGYRVSKPLIQIRNKPMMIAACESFPPSAKWVFLTRQEDMQKHSLEAALHKFQPGCSIIPVDHETSGQAATCMLGAHELNANAPVFIASCDYETRYNPSAWQRVVDDESIDGVIWTIRLGGMLTKNPKAFAYCVTKADGKTIERVVEKDTISDTPSRDPLVVGSFWFRRAEDFTYAAKTAIERNYNVNGEHYVGNSINLLLEQGKKFVIFEVDQWISYGDPFELEVYQYWEDHFTAGQEAQHLARG